MPDLTNYKEEDARAALVKLGIPEENITIVEKFDEDIAEGKVIETSPATGETVTLTQSITLFLSMGETEQSVVVPDVLGYKESEARAKLTDFTVMTVLVQSAKESGVVVEQSLTKGTQVAKGSTITLSISNGQAPTNDVTVSVAIPSGADDETYTFTGELDGKEVVSQRATPSETSSLSMTVSGSQESATFVVYVTVDGKKKTYATYEINFVEKTAVLQGTINGDLVMPKVKEGTVNFAVSLPKNATNRQVTFYVYSDGVLISSKTINPALSASLPVSATGTGTGTITVNVNMGAGEKTYAEYSVDYSTESVDLIAGVNEYLLEEEESSDTEAEPEEEDLDED
jgi:hypothetical protein